MTSRQPELSIIGNSSATQSSQTCLDKLVGLGMYLRLAAPDCELTWAGSTASCAKHGPRRGCLLVYSRMLG